MAQGNLDLTSKINVSQLSSDETGFFIANSAKYGTPTNGKRIFCRVDYNVPLDDEQKITDTRRIESTIPTLKTLLALNPSRLILVSHLGRPAGNVTPKLSLQPVVPVLEGLLGRKVEFVQDWFQDGLDERLGQFPAGSVILLENVRFYIEEEGKGKVGGEKVKADAANVQKFRDLLSSLGDLYVNDAFACCHRAHSSMVGVNVSLKAAGLLVKKELDYFNKALSAPTRPYLAILGGAKVADKIKVIESLLDRVDEMIIAGGMCYTFLKVLNNMAIGGSIFDDEGAKLVQSLMDKAAANNVKVTLPVDWVCGDSFSADANTQIAGSASGIPDGWEGLDIATESIKLCEEAIARAKTLVWNGPPGVFEFDKFSQGTQAVLAAVAQATANGCSTIVGGGDSAAACKKWGYDDKVSHVSTGGGASLELLEGKVLPGLDFISDA